MNISEEEFKQLAGKLLKYMMGKLKLTSPPPKLILKKDEENAKDTWGFTGHYNPNDKSITLFVTDRHHIDVLRSFAHEVIHFAQDEWGTLKPEEAQKSGAQYAQKSPHMRKIELEAYARGNIIFRDFQDLQRYGDKS